MKRETFLLGAGAIAVPLLTVQGISRAAAGAGLAPLTTGGDWLNARADAASLQGRVVVVDVFTFGCINCKHVVPNLKHLHALAARGVAVVGVHAPETPYERVRENIVTNLHTQGITWPVRLDEQFAVWNAYNIQYWPTQLVFDRQGKLRKTIIGEGQDSDLNTEVERLLAEHA